MESVAPSSIGSWPAWPLIFDPLVSTSSPWGIFAVLKKALDVFLDKLQRHRKIGGYVT